MVVNYQVKGSEPLKEGLSGRAVYPLCGLLKDVKNFTSLEFFNYWPCDYLPGILKILKR